MTLLNVKPSKLFLLILFVSSICISCNAEWRDTAFSVPDSSRPWPWPEGNKKINDAKKKFPMAGTTVLAYVRNTSVEPATLQRLNWNGTDIEELAKLHRVVWWRMNPRGLKPGGVGEITIRFQQPLKETGRLVVTFSNDVKTELNVPPREPPLRIQSIIFAPDRQKVYLYIEKARDDTLPRTILMDGRTVPGRVRWLSNDYVGSLLVAVIELDQPLIEGSWHTWTVYGGDVRVGATLRVVSNPVCFGTYGGEHYSRFADNGLNGYYSFRPLDVASLDTARSHGIRVAMHIRRGTPPQAAIAHPSLFGYNVMDEPDCHDYSKGKKLPVHLRLGTLAPRMVEYIQRCGETDPTKPVMLTLNLTFMPNNYYTYGQIADITTPDCYPIANGQSLEFLRDAAMHAKRATAPRPFGFIYQGCWEEWALPQKKWMGRAAVLAKGFENLRDPKHTRGFGRKPEPAEIRIQMAYALGAGAKSLWSFIDSTALSGKLLYHGSIDLPDVWREIGRMNRTLRQAAQQIGLSHPISWAKTDAKKLWVRTLICGEDAALVVIVNENYRCDKKGFASTPARSVTVEFPDLPWLKAKRVEMLTPKGGVTVPTILVDGATTWQIAELADIAIFRILGRK